MALNKKKFLQLYSQHEKKVDIAFFVAGFLFDVLTLSEVDDAFSILQQLVYLAVIGALLVADLLIKNHRWQWPARWSSVWPYRDLILHFLLGSLLSVYSLFFLKSSSLFSSFLFVVILMGLMVANELKIVRESQLNLKMGLFFVCLFAFLATLIPTALGFVGWFPFILILTSLAFMIWGLGSYLKKKKNLDDRSLRSQVVGPGAVVLIFMFLFYLLGLIPPVPLAISKFGIYHNIQKEGPDYRLSFERPFWKIWQKGAQSFLAEPGDRIFFFVSVYSPARFEDSVILHWSHNSQGEWRTTDRVPMRLMGGRKQGFRGFSSKSNFSEGAWRIQVETTNGQEIGRIYFDVEKRDVADPTRNFQTEMY